ncbi:hypothetical protein KAU33_14565 [Candidatus Dependentiae bacterium]|nr:hypothetical protein [Candidatus Dependentiae bacterium]
MKKFIFTMILVLFFTLINYSESKVLSFGEENDFGLTIHSEKNQYKRGEEIFLVFKIKNLSLKILEIPPFLPIDNRLPDLQVKLEVLNNFSNKIENDYYKNNPYSGISGGKGELLEPKETVFITINLTDYYNIEELNEVGIIEFRLNYALCELERLSHFSGYVNVIGYINTNTVRIFFNMDQELIQSQIRVEPHKWNVNWEDMEGDGVFTVWIETIKGYSVEDVKQDTILLNGTLKPEDIKILPKSGNNKEKVLQLKFKKKDGIQYLGELKTGEKKTINISAQLTDEKWFVGETEIEIVGKKNEENK